MAWPELMRKPSQNNLLLLEGPTKKLPSHLGLARLAVKPLLYRGVPRTATVRSSFENVGQHHHPFIW